VPNGHHPAYFIYFDLAPEAIDVNIHPTKTEIKFEEEKSIYAILRSTVKRSIGQYHVSPSIDFDREVSFDIPPPSRGFQPSPPGITVNPNFNPFDKEKQQQKSDWERGSAFQHRVPHNTSSIGWEKLYDGLAKPLDYTEEHTAGGHDGLSEQLLELSGDDDNTIVRQIGLKYILVQSQEGIFLIHQYRAHVRILFEGFEEAMIQAQPASQQRLFPSQITLSAQDTILLQGLFEPLKAIGFEVESLGQQSFVVQAVPAACTDMNVEDVLGGFIDDLRDDRPTDEQALRLNVIKSMAQRSAIKSGKQLEAQEMLSIFRSLMRCKQPQHDLNGRPTFVLLNSGMLDKLFD
jgi:DNA mismatch repair protein MutL